MVYTPPRLTPLRYLPRDFLNQMVNINNKYACGKLVFILLVIEMVNLPNPFLQILYNTNKISGKKVEIEKSFKHTD